MFLRLLLLALTPLLAQLRGRTAQQFAHNDDGTGS